jgi:hypothetical protein
MRNQWNKSPNAPKIGDLAQSTLKNDDSSKSPLKKLAIPQKVP